MIYIALLRGINVGGKNLLPMKSLTEILQKLGCQNIQTYIQSGNAVFDLKPPLKKDLDHQLGAAILKLHGLSPNVMILKASELADAIAHCPYETDEGKLLHFFFCKTKPKNPDLDSLNKLKTTSEQFHLSRKVFYLLSPDGIGRSKLAASAERLLGASTTARNWNTVAKLNSMIKSGK